MLDQEHNHCRSKRAADPGIFWSKNFLNQVFSPAADPQNNRAAFYRLKAVHRTDVSDFAISSGLLSRWSAADFDPTIELQGIRKRSDLVLEYSYDACFQSLYPLSITLLENQLWEYETRIVFTASSNGRCRPKYDPEELSCRNMVFR